MISVSAGDYHGGEYLYRGLTALGQGLSDALTRYQQMKDQQTQADMLMSTLAQTPDPTEYNPETGGGQMGPGGMGLTGDMAGGAGAAGGPLGILAAAASGDTSKSGSSGSKPKAPRMILDRNNYERYLAMSGRNHAAAAAGLMGALQMFHSMQKAASDEALNRAQIRSNLAHADYYEARKDPAKELQLFANPAVTTVRPGPNDAQFDPFAMVQVSPQQWRPIQRPGEPVYDENTGLYILPAGPTGGKPTVINPADAAAANALKPQPAATPKPGGPISRFFGRSKPSSTARPAAPSGAEDVRQEAEAYLQRIGLPLTEANIQHYIDQRNASSPK